MIESFAAEAEEVFLALEATLVEEERRLQEGAPVSAASLRGHLPALHTVKGNAGMLGMAQFSAAVHQLEEIVKRARPLDAAALKGLLRLVDDGREDLARIRDGAEDALGLAVWTEWLMRLADGDDVAGDVVDADLGTRERLTEGSERERRSLRVASERLDELQREVGELILAHNALADVLAREVRGRLDRGAARSLQDALDRLSRRVRYVQSATTRTRLLSLGTILRRVPRIARDAAERSGKAVRVEVIGDEAEADKVVVDALAEAIVHLVRNAVDHGIEAPSARRRLGKPEAGRLTVRVAARGEVVSIEVGDDGAGIDIDRVRAKAVERGLVDADAAASAEDEVALRWLFRAGFSTRDRASELSGRGVGLDVVDRTVRDLGGAVRLEHRPGQGTRFILTVPVSTAVADLMEIVVAERNFFVPLTRIIATGRFDASMHERPGGADHYRFRDELLPLLPFAEALGGQPATGNYVIVFEHASGKAGVRIERIVGKGQAVLTPLGDPLLRHGPFAGGTVRGDGRVGLILDPDRLVAWQRVVGQ